MKKVVLAALAAWLLGFVAVYKALTYELPQLDIDWGDVDG